MKMHTSLLLQAILIPAFLAVVPPKAYAQTEFLYTNDNQTNGPNTVSAFSIGNNGKLRLLEGSPYSTGAPGPIGFNEADVNNSIQVRKNLLIVGNKGSISVFTIDAGSGALSLVPGSPFAIAGTTSGFGIALTVSPDNHFLFAGDVYERELTVFAVGPDGSLTTVKGSPFAINGEPANMEVTPGNRFLIVSLLTQGIGVYRISTDGEIAPITGSPYPSNAAGIAVNCNASLLFAAADGVPRVDVLHISADGILTPIPGSPFMGPGNGYIAVALNSADKFLYVTDFSKAVVNFSVAHDGSLTVVHGSPFSVASQIAGLIPDEDDEFLFVTRFGIPEDIFAFAARPHGALTMVPGSPFHNGENGTLTSLATFPGKTCPSR
jgi:6-phosphogluconolactonase (cycloisomerase 2 family)